MLISGAIRFREAPDGYYVPPHIQGLNVSTATKYATIASAFGVSAGVFALFFFGEVPRVRNDLLRKVPFLDEYYDRSIPAEDNPF
ncbi:cytochrome b-c1 complex subunit 10 [Aspergillus clavatus NRRL 1]|uniref:Uncharacterized protein n=1 Tax=Aspergillus clavatus (strain ATCC 1007 / CBS 513.65 / DSM 816 / NCTC 3887 / NRRL 1 / QM 1276 / 107) TaxID=344612 RepID=A1C6A7_ASPCL|nr:uncharacterized protein ACLA_069580 [Aspergillus clavatus NRRL 1]EAW13928.1 conserved hypothetical protein [Aspergillus clavatus NRRL 1]